MSNPPYSPFSKGGFRGIFIRSYAGYYKMQKPSSFLPFEFSAIVPDESGNYKIRRRRSNLRPRSLVSLGTSSAVSRERAAAKPPFVLHISLIYSGLAVPLSMNISATISAITITTIAIMPPVPSPPANQPPPPTTSNCPLCPQIETS